MSERTCAVDTCGGKHEARGWCSIHYDRWRATGDPLGSRIPDMPPDRPGEHWMPIPGYEGTYEASSLGRIRSLNRVITDRRGKARSLRGQILRANKNLAGRPMVQLYAGGRARPLLVQTLVLLAFVGPRPPGHEGCHGDGNPANNHVGNLRWDTRRENTLDRERHGTNHQRNKTHCPHGHRLAEPNLTTWAAARRHRMCRACSLAYGMRSKAKRRGRPSPFDFQEDADRRYAAIMSQA
jgi:hypothetical protein